MQLVPTNTDRYEVSPLSVTFSTPMRLSYIEEFCTKHNINVQYGDKKSVPSNSNVHKERVAVLESALATKEAEASELRSVADQAMSLLSSQTAAASLQTKTAEEVKAVASAYETLYEQESKKRTDLENSILSIVDEFDQAIQNIPTQVQTYEALFADQEKMIKELQGMYSSHKDAADYLLEENKSLSSRIQAYERDQAQLKEEKEVLSSEYKSLQKEHEDTKSLAENYTHKIHGLESDLKEMNDTAEILATEVQEAKAKHQESNDFYTTQSDNLQQTIQAYQTQVAQLLAVNSDLKTNAEKSEERVASLESILQSKNKKKKSSKRDAMHTAIDRKYPGGMDALRKDILGEASETDRKELLYEASVSPPLDPSAMDDVVTEPHTAFNSTYAPTKEVVAQKNAAPASEYDLAFAAEEDILLLTEEVPEKIIEPKADVSTSSVVDVIEESGIEHIIGSKKPSLKFTAPVDDVYVPAPKKSSITFAAPVEDVYVPAADAQTPVESTQKVLNPLLYQEVEGKPVDVDGHIAETQIDAPVVQSINEDLEVEDGFLLKEYEQIMDDTERFIADAQIPLVISDASINAPLMPAPAAVVYEPTQKTQNPLLNQPTLREEKPLVSQEYARLKEITLTGIAGEKPVAEIDNEPLYPVEITQKTGILYDAIRQEKPLESQERKALDAVDDITLNEHDVLGLDESFAKQKSSEPTLEEIAENLELAEDLPFALEYQSVMDDTEVFLSTTGDILDNQTRKSIEKDIAPMLLGDDDILDVGDIELQEDVFASKSEYQVSAPHSIAQPQSIFLPYTGDIAVLRKEDFIPIYDIRKQTTEQFFQARKNDLTQFLEKLIRPSNQERSNAMVQTLHRIASSLQVPSPKVFNTLVGEENVADAHTYLLYQTITSKHPEQTRKEISQNLRRLQAELQK